MAIVSVDKWKHLQLDDVYHPKYQEYIRWFLDVTFVISAILYSFTAYVILTKSPKQMGGFKYTILTQITFNMLYKLAVFLFNPIMIFPLPVISCNSYFFNFTTIDFVIPLLGAIFFTIIAAAAAILLSVINRVIAGFDTTASKKTQINIFYGILAFLGIFLLIWTTAMIPIFLIAPKLESSFVSLKNEVPLLVELTKILPTTFGLHPDLVGDLLLAFIIIAVSWTLLYATVFISLNIIVVYQLRKIRKMVSKTTYGIHKMLHT